MRNDDMAVVVNGVRKTYGKGKIVALDDVSFKVRRGEVIGLLGPNGAGKTTMVDILSTLTRPDAGSRSSLATMLFPNRPVYAARSWSPGSRWPSTTRFPVSRTWCCLVVCGD